MLLAVLDFVLAGICIICVVLILIDKWVRRYSNELQVFVNDERTKDELRARADAMYEQYRDRRISEIVDELIESVQND